ncbi:MAG: hypothetical protein WCV63_02280 [Negativicutes bacterium]
MIKLDIFVENISRLLYSLLYFIEQESDNTAKIEIDVPMYLQFSNAFDEYSYRNAIANFLAHHGIAINREFFETTLTLRQLSNELEQAELVAESQFADLLKSIRIFVLRNEEARYAAMENNQLHYSAYLH